MHDLVPVREAVSDDPEAVSGSFKLKLISISFRPDEDVTDIFALKADRPERLIEFFESLNVVSRRDPAGLDEQQEGDDGEEYFLHVYLKKNFL